MTVAETKPRRQSPAGAGGSDSLSLRLSRDSVADNQKGPGPCQGPGKAAMNLSWARPGRGRAGFGPDSMIHLSALLLSLTDTGTVTDGNR